MRRSTEPPAAIEVFRNVSVNSTSPRFVAKVIEQDTQLVDISLTLSQLPDNGGETHFIDGQDWILLTMGNIWARKTIRKLACIV